MATKPEVKLIYNDDDKAFYLYLGEDFLENYADIDKAMIGYLNAINMLICTDKAVEEEDLYHNIREVFGWKGGYNDIRKPRNFGIYRKIN